VRSKFQMAKDFEEAAIAMDEMYNSAYQVAGQ
jgi:regulator of nonsense transcripts 2